LSKHLKFFKKHFIFNLLVISFGLALINITIFYFINIKFES